MELVLVLVKNIPLVELFQVKNLCRNMKSFETSSMVKGSKCPCGEIAWFK